jgi:hypothetical protein
VKDEEHTQSDEEGSHDCKSHQRFAFCSEDRDQRRRSQKPGIRNGILIVNIVEKHKSGGDFY